MGKEKKEIGIEKLIELLNEYSKEIGFFNEEDLQGQTKAWILSKEFGWVKWLVENDKIDIHNIPPISITKGGEETAYNEPVMLDDSLLMLLAIQDEPISFLISILK